MFFTNFDFGMLSLAVLGMDGMKKNEGTLNISDFTELDIRIGTIIKCELFPEAKGLSYKLTLDFGELGQRSTTARITEAYDVDTLMGKQVVAIINLPVTRVTDLMNECLLLGVNNDNKVTLLVPDRPVKDGLPIL